MADTTFVSDKHLTLVCYLDLGRGNLNFMHDTPSHFAFSFYEIDSIPFIGFSVMADTRFVSVKPLTLDCDLDLGRGNINFVRDTPSYFALSFYKI